MAHVLIVEDSPTDVQSMRSALEEAGHDVSVAAAAAEALDAAKRLRPDLILMDVVFQGMSGFQGTRKLNRDPDTAEIPVIIISSKNQESDRVWGLRQGAAEYLTKPVRPKTLVQKVTDVLAHGEAD